MKRIVTFIFSFICLFYVNDCAIHKDEVCEAHLAFFEKSLDLNEEWALQSKLIDTTVSQNGFFLLTTSPSVRLMDKDTLWYSDG